MVSADAGDDFGRQTARFLGRLLSERGVLLAAASAATSWGFGSTLQGSSWYPLAWQTSAVCAACMFSALCMWHMWLQVCTDHYTQRSPLPTTPRIMSCVSLMTTGWTLSRCGCTRCILPSHPMAKGTSLIKKARPWASSPSRCLVGGSSSTAGL